MSIQEVTPVTESELKARSLAPRVTEKELRDNIATVNFINVGKAIARTDEPDHESHHLLTLCILALQNGFTVVGQSACVSRENYDEEIGQRIAYEDAKRQVWPLMGYALRDQLAKEAV